MPISTWTASPKNKTYNINKAKFVIEEALKRDFYISDIEARDCSMYSFIEPEVSQPEIWIGLTVRDKQCLDVLCGKDGDVVFFVMDYHQPGEKPEKTRCYLGKHADTIRECFAKCLKALDCYYRSFCIEVARKELIDGNGVKNV